MQNDPGRTPKRGFPTPEQVKVISKSKTSDDDLETPGLQKFLQEGGPRTRLVFFSPPECPIPTV